MDDKISVIIPIYNVEKYLCRCIDSVLAQTYTNIEIILVDDGSPDRCGEICDEYAKRDKRIKVIHKKNGGLSDARNTGIEAATGEYIGFVDSDDYIREDMYEKLYAALKDNNADISISNFKYVNEDTSFVIDNDNLPINNEILSGSDILSEKMCEDKQWYWVVAWNKLYKRELFSDIKYSVGKIHEDEFIIHQLLSKCRCVACVPDMLYYYLQREGSIMSEKHSIRCFDYAEALIERSGYLIDNGYRSLTSYYWLMRSVSYLATCYSQCRREDTAKARYTELKKMYRKTARKQMLLQMSMKQRIHLIADYICPYYAEGLRLKFKMCRYHII